MQSNHKSLIKANLSLAAARNVLKWLEDDKYQDFRSDITELIHEQKWGDLEDAFYKILEFGTAGRRGKTGAGPNRINQITIGESAAGLCEYLAGRNSKYKLQGIVIAYDTRLTSKSLAKYTARVVAANGFKVYLFENFRSTPELSFAIRYLKAASGIVISASHNPPADNGFKVYSATGGQLVPPDDKGVLKASMAVREIKTINFDQAVKAGKIEFISSKVDQAYFESLLTLSKTDNHQLNIVYSPLHGTGQTSVLPLLRSLGFEVSVVEDQMIPDGNFPNVPNHKPNPEEPAANDMTIAQMVIENSDVAITTDPDADRLAISCSHKGQIIRFNGNQSAVLALNYQLQQLSTSKQLTSNHFICKTIVTTDMLTALAKQYGIKIYGDLPVGFKFIGQTIDDRQAEGEIFVAGAEESYGMLVGDYARDKDAASGALSIMEAASDLKATNQTLYDQMLTLYKKLGIYVEATVTVAFPGVAGFIKIQKLMADLRTSPPTKIGSHKVSAILDYQILQRFDLASGKTEAFECLSKGEVIVLELENYQNRLTIRPSGTESKLKIYGQLFKPYQSVGTTVEEQYQQLKVELEQLVKIAQEKLLG